jgi:hypothetical protein
MATADELGAATLFTVAALAFVVAVTIRKNT